MNQPLPPPDWKARVGTLGQFAMTVDELRNSCARLTVENRSLCHRLRGRDLTIAHLHTLIERLQRQLDAKG